MKNKLIALAGAALLASGLAPLAAAQDIRRTVDLFQFDGASGYSPQAGVITDSQGTVFGTTTIGGNGPCLAQAGCGTLYALLPPTSRAPSWRFKKLYDFQGSQDGGFPRVQLTLGPTGDLYGYTADGTLGSVFRLSPPAIAGNPWQFQTLYVFKNGADGNLDSAFAPLVLRRGVLYGVASGGSTACGQFGCGSVFRLTPTPGGGPWTEKTLFRFSGRGDGGLPNSIVAVPGGNALYVATSRGDGAVVQLSPPNSPGPWTETVITRFLGAGDGQLPNNLVLGSDGALFGLADMAGEGVAFQLTPPSGGSPWTRTTIAAIEDHGYGPVSLAQGAGGALIGAIEGDVDFYAGSIFQLTPPAGGGAWTYTLVKSFNRGPDRNPLNVVTGREGNLFGVFQGGDSTNGSLFVVR